MKKTAKIQIFFTFLFLLFLFAWTPTEVLAANASKSDAKDIVVGITVSPSGKNVIGIIEDLGATAYSLPLVSSKAEARRELSKIDALVISGGIDIDPSFYGQTPSDKLEDVSPERDISEILMVQVAMERDMPVLGICRGMQLINIVQGGTLYQDIADEYANVSEDISHRDFNKKLYTNHEITIEKNSLLYEIVQSKSLNVLSFHHQAVKDLGKNLTVIARSKDGIIEALQHDKKTFILGVQFHPEQSVVQNNAEQIEFFETLIQQGAIYRNKVLSKLSTPSVATCVLNTYDSVKVYWDSVNAASEYAVYYKKASASNYSLLQRTDNTYVITGSLSDGVQYVFKIVPCIKRNDTYYEGSSFAVTNIYTLKKMNAPQVNGYSDTQVTLSCEDIAGQNGYQISRSTSKTGTNIISTWKTTSAASKLVSSGSTVGRPYYYKIRAYKTVAGNKIYGPWSDAVKYTRQLPSPENVTANLIGYDDIRVSWKKVSGASGYSVYCKKGESGSYKLLKRTTKLEVQKKDLVDGAKYYFKVVPYYKSGNTYFNSTNYQTVHTYTLKKMAAPTVIKQADSKVAVNWKDISGQTGYQISRSTSKTGTNIVCTWNTTTGETKTISKGSGKKVRYYKIRAFQTVNGKRIYGPWSNSVKFS